MVKLLSRFGPTITSNIAKYIVVRLTKSCSNLKDKLIGMMTPILNIVKNMVFKKHSPYEVNTSSIFIKSCRNQFLNTQNSIKFLTHDCDVTF